MSWFFYALIASIFFSASLLTDKFLLTRYFKNFSTVSLLTAAALAGMPFFILFLLILQDFPDTRTFSAGLIAGWLVMAGYQLYFLALRKADTALITTLWQLILPFNYIIGVGFFNEAPTLIQTLGLVVVATGAIMISLEEKEEKWTLRKDVLFLMITASLLLSFSNFVFKFASETASFLELAVSEYASSIIAGIALLVLVPQVRKELGVLKRRFLKPFAVMEFNEMLTVGGTIAMRYALFLGPLALIQGILATQPVITVFMTILLSFLGLKINSDRPKALDPKKRFWLELVSILLVCLGSAMIVGLF